MSEYSFIIMSNIYAKLEQWKLLFCFVLLYLNLDFKQNPNETASSLVKWHYGKNILKSALERRI